MLTAVEFGFAVLTGMSYLVQMVLIVICNFEFLKLIVFEIRFSGDAVLKGLLINGI